MYRYIAVAVFAVLTMSVSGAAPVSAAENQDNQQSESTENRSENYRYVVQSGDNYSLLARKAVQTYGIINNVNLSQAEIIAAETFVTLAAHSPEVQDGQEVVMDVSAVKSAIEKAQKLSADEKAAWAEYVSMVDFNTNRVGQS